MKKSIYSLFIFMGITSSALAQGLMEETSEEVAQEEAAKAEDTPQGEVSGFSFVLPSKNGGKQSIVRGDTANFLPDGQIEIVNVKTQVFREKSSDMFITSPKATFNKVTREVVTDQDVEIATQEMVIVGTGLHWEPNQNKAEIQKNVKVTILSKPGNLDF